MKNPVNFKIKLTILIASFASLIFIIGGLKDNRLAIVIGAILLVSAPFISLILTVKVMGKEPKQHIQEDKISG